MPLQPRLLLPEALTMSWLKRLADALEAAPQRGSGYPSGDTKITDLAPPTQGVEPAATDSQDPNRPRP